MENDPAIASLFEQNASKNLLTEPSGWREIMRKERERHGENLAFGPGYGECVADYYERELGEKLPNNGLLDDVAARYGIPRNEIVPVPFGSLDSGQYLADVVAVQQRIPLSNALEIAVCSNPAAALKLRGYAPVIYPLTITQQARERMQKDGIVDTPLKLETGNTTRQQLAELLHVSAEHLTMNFGSDEVLKAIFRGQSLHSVSNRAFIPVPNFSDSLFFAQRFGLAVVPGLSEDVMRVDIQSWIESIQTTQPDLVYISSPNNPTGYSLSQQQIRSLIQVCPPSAVFVIDEVGIDTRLSRQLFSFDWQQLFNEFTDRRIVVLDSMSKSHQLAKERVGFGIVSNPDDAALLQSFEPPYFLSKSIGRTIEAIQNPGIELIVTEKINQFSRKLSEVQSHFPGKIAVGPSTSNFCVVEFLEPHLIEVFLKELAGLDAGQIPAKAIVGAPLTGAGEISSRDLNSDGTLHEAFFKRTGIIGLANNTVRFSTLNHPLVLDVLDRLLADQ